MNTTTVVIYNLFLEITSKYFTFSNSRTQLHLNNVLINCNTKNTSLKSLAFTNLSAWMLCYLKIYQPSPGLRKDIWCHISPYSFCACEPPHQATAGHIKHVQTCVVSLVIADRLIMFLWGLCGCQLVKNDQFTLPEAFTVNTIEATQKFVLQLCTGWVREKKYFILSLTTQQRLGKKKLLSTR